MQPTAPFAGVLICLTALMGQSIETSPPGYPGRVVSIGERRLHINCTGRGQPTVALIHGAGAYSFDWEPVQGEIAKTTRVCSYDQAGHAWSDLPTAAQSLSELARDLHRLLEAAGETGPFVLVGHSRGGGVVRVFADQYPEQVAGAVLVDTGHPDSKSIINGKLVAITAETLPPMTGARSAYGGVPADPKAQIGAPFDKLPTAVQQLRLWCLREGKAAASDSVAEVRSAEELRRVHARGSEVFGQKPLALIFRAKGGYRPIKGILTAGQAEELERERLVHIADMQKLSRNPVAMVGEQSGHNVHLDQPALVVEAIRKVIDMVGKGSSSGQ